MFKKLSKFWQRWKLDRDFRRKGIVGGKNRKVEDNMIAEAADKSRILGILLLFLLWGVSSLLLTFPCRSDLQQKFTEGVSAHKNVFAEFPFTYESSIATREARQLAAENAPDHYVINEVDTGQMRRRFQVFFHEVAKRSTVEKTNSAHPGTPKTYVPSVHIPLSNEVAELRRDDFVIFNNLLADNANYNKFYQELDKLISSGILSSVEKNKKSVGKKIVIVDLVGREHIPRRAGDVNSVDGAAKILAEKISGGLSIQQLFIRLFGEKGNLHYDEAASKLAAAAAAKAVAEEVVEVKQNAVIIAKNNIVDAKMLEKYNAYIDQYRSGSTDWEILLKNIFTGLLLVFFVGFYMYHIHPEIILSNKKLALLGFVTIFSLLFNYAAIKLYIIGGEMFNLPQQYLLYFSPYTLASVVLAVSLGFRVALYIGFFVASLLALMNGGGFEFAFLGIVTCSLSALAVRNAANYRAFFFWSLLPVWLVGFICFLPNIHADRLAETLVSGAIISFTNGFLTSIIALLFVFFIELIFNVPTNMSLLLLINSHPLLERLKREAPGTYFHCMMVATLAEDAATAIGANAIRAKCGALYHDIGKLAKPQYFTENNLENDNQHTALNPHVSSMIIREHVNEGLALAKKYKLNRVIRDAIEQHHGNDLVHYFYNRAIHETKNGTQINEEQFRYQGDLPCEKEIVIISLADACEAAVRSLEKPSVQKIEMMIDEIFKKRFRDNQLDQAQITLKELHKVRESFVTNLISMRHGRIAYHKDENSGNEDENDLFVAAAKEQPTAEPGKNKEIY